MRIPKEPRCSHASVPCRPDPRFQIGISTMAPERPEKAKLRPRLKRALEKWAKLKGFRFVAVLEQNGGKPGITDERTRVQHADTKWRSDQLRKAAPGIS
jgi:hypothetical protein